MAILETELAVNTHPDIIRSALAMNIRTAAGAILATAAVAWAAPAALAQPITTNLHVGDFTYQFADPTTGIPITWISNPPMGGTARVAVYLIQLGGTPTNLLQQLGVEGIGVRLNYADPAGIVMVPNTFNSNITQRPPPVNNPNSVSSDFSIVQRYGAGTGTDTTISAAISEGLVNSDDPLPVPGAEDPLSSGNRMLIGTFTLRSLILGVEHVTAVSGPSFGVNILTGPNPPIIGPRNDGTFGPMPGNGLQGEIHIDQFLAQNLPTPVIPTLLVIPFPEPSTFTLGFLAAAGLAVCRRRMAGAVAA